jgi:hypothetical protein
VADLLGANRAVRQVADSFVRGIAVLQVRGIRVVEDSRDRNALGFPLVQLLGHRVEVDHVRPRLGSSREECPLVLRFRPSQHGERAAARLDQLGDLVPRATTAPHERDERGGLELMVVGRHR